MPINIQEKTFCFFKFLSINNNALCNELIEVGAFHQLWILLMIELSFI